MALHRGGRSLLAIFALLGCAFVALSVWQVERRTWKHALIARVDARLHAAPVDAPGRARWTRIDPDDAYRPVRLRGIYQRGCDTFVRAVTVFGSGYWVVTPLRRDDDSTVLINRGFVSGDQRRVLGPVADGPTTVTGLLRSSEPGGSFMARNDPVDDRWVSRDVAAIAAKRGLAEVAPYFVDAGPAADGIEAAAARGGPVGGLTVVSFTDNHLLYAVIWGVLAALNAIAGFVLWKTGRRSRRAP